MIAWCLMLAVIGLGTGAFIAGWHLVQAQDRINREKDEEIRSYKNKIKELEAYVQQINQKLEEEVKARTELQEKLKEKIEEYERMIEEREEEIARLRLRLAEKERAGPGKRFRPKRSRILE